jgi:hypothetical protein
MLVPQHFFWWWWWCCNSQLVTTQLIQSRLVMMGWLTSQNCGLYGPIVHPRVIAMWTLAWWYRLGLTPNPTTRALSQPPVLSGSPVNGDISGVSTRIDEGNENLVYLSAWDFKRSLTCCKILQNGTSGFTSHPKEGVLRIFIALKNPSPWPGSSLRPLGPVAKHTNHYTTKEAIQTRIDYITETATSICNKDSKICWRHVSSISS